MDRRSQSRPPSVVVVTINQPEVEHRVRIKDFENWLDSAGKSPAEMRPRAACGTSSETSHHVRPGNEGYE